MIYRSASARLLCLLTLLGAAIVALIVLIVNGAFENALRFGQAPAVDASKLPKKVKDTFGPPVILKATTGAVLDLTKSPVGTLFETKMLASERLKWLERSQLDKVLAEQELQALFGPEAGAQRAGLGKVLRADVLILLRTLEPKNKGVKWPQQLELVVCETQRGLRLLVQELPTSKDAEEDVEALEILVDDALRKVNGKITDVCAVPPFLSNDLDYKFEHLKAAFARILEQRLLKRPGVLVVELAEAQALAKESSFAGGDAVQRLLPVYFLGEFRNEGKDDQRRLTLNVKLRRGDQELAKETLGEIEPDKAATSLAQLADVLAGRVVAKVGAGQIDPKAEAKQLADRARVFQRVGGWEESRALLEASLLLNADEAARSNAALSCSNLAHEQLQQGRNSTKHALLGMATYRRMLELEEAHMRSGGKLDPPRVPGMEGKLGTQLNRSFLRGFMAVREFVLDSPDTEERKSLRDLKNQVMKETQTFFLNLCRWRARNGYGDEYRYLAWTTSFLPEPERYPFIHDMILELKDLPFPHERAVSLINRWFVQGLSPDVESVVFLDQLLGAKDPDITAAVALVKKKLEKHLEALRPPVVENSDQLASAPPDSQELRFKPLTLTWQAPGGNAVRVEPILGCLPVGEGVDLVAAPYRLFLMKEKGRLKRVWEAGEYHAYAEQYCHDGRYVWIPIRRPGKSPRLVVLDPVSESTWEFTTADGLPVEDPKNFSDESTRSTLAAAPLAPGKACLAGFGEKTWLAVATLDPVGGRSVKVFHEARDFNDRIGDWWKRTNTRLDPTTLRVVTDKPEATGQPPLRVLVGSSWLVDPELQRVSPTTQSFHKQLQPEAQASSMQRDGEVYFLGHGNSEARHVGRIGFFPTLKSSVLTKGLAPGQLTFFGDRLHLFVHWESRSAPDDKLGLSHSPMIKGFRGAAQSAHYGTIAFVDVRLDTTAYQVDFPNGHKAGRSHNVVLPTPRIQASANPPPESALPLAASATASAAASAAATAEPPKQAPPQDQSRPVGVGKVPAGPAPIQQIRYRPVSLTWDAPNGKTVQVAPIMGCLPVGKGIDLVVAPLRLFLMKDQGRVKRVWEAADYDARPEHYCFDGRYAWIPIQAHKNMPKLLVLDPVSEKTWEFNADDGLPLADPASLPPGTRQLLAAAPLAPGKVCLAGSFGRSWLAIATFDPVGGKTVKVFHEARELPDPNIKGFHQPATVAFEPFYVRVLSDQPDAAGRRAQRIIVGRINPYANPLVVDPDRLEVHTGLDRHFGDGDLRLHFEKDGALHYLGGGKPYEPHLLRIGFPKLESEVIARDLRPGQPAFFGAMPHVFIEEYFWKEELPSKPSLSYSKMPKGFRGMAQSSHYGTLVIADTGAGTGAYQVDFPSGQKPGPAENVILPAPPITAANAYPKLEVTSPKAFTPKAPTITRTQDGVVIEGELTSADKTLTATGHPYKNLNAKMAKGQAYLIVLESKGFDGSLRVALAGQLLAKETGADRTGRLEFTAPEDGSYVVQIVSNDRRLGAYRLTIRKTN